MPEPVAISPGFDRISVEIAVVLPTFRRPVHAARTLRSLAKQTVGVPFAVVVVENDAAGMEGVAAARSVLAEGELEGMIVVEERQGNCNAYNAGFNAALTMFPRLTHVAIIDDDEVAVPDWLALLHEACTTAGADIAGGPQKPQFEDVEGARLYGAHPVFRSAHDATGRTQLITSTGNCMISAYVLRHMRPHFLDERFNFLGGGDTDFFTRCRKEGFEFNWVQEAAVLETVPARRTERRWITARSLRNGIISSIVQRRQSPGPAGRAKVLAKSLALLAVSPFRSAILALQTGSAYIGAYHMLVAVGRLMAEFGLSVDQYREPDKN